MEFINSVAIELLCLHRKFLVYNLVQRNLKLKYRQSMLGIFWSLLSPGLNACVFYFAFSFVMRIKMDHYLAFILTGVMTWTFFSTTLMTGMESIAGNYALVNKVPLPLNVFPLAETVTNFINYLLSIPALIVVGLFTHTPLTLAVLLVPFFLTLVFIQAYAFSLILSIAYVYFRDLRHIMAAVLQMWMYSTPVIYSSEMIPEKARFVLWLNPMAMILEGLHGSFVTGITLSPEKIAVATGWTVLIALIGGYVFARNRSNLVEGI